MELGPRHLELLCAGTGEQRCREAKRWVHSGNQTYLHFFTTPRHFGDVAHDVFGCHCFPSTAFSTVQMSKTEER